MSFCCEAVGAAVIKSGGQLLIFCVNPAKAWSGYSSALISPVTSHWYHWGPPHWYHWWPVTDITEDLSLISPVTSHWWPLTDITDDPSLISPMTPHWYHRWPLTDITDDLSLISLMTSLTDITDDLSLISLMTSHWYQWWPLTDITTTRLGLQAREYNILVYTTDV